MMASENLYDACLPILQDENLEEEEKTEKLEDLVRKETDPAGVENAVLDILWRFRSADNPSAFSPPVRHTVVRRQSPAPWQISRGGTPTNSSPRSTVASPALPAALAGRPSYFRMKSNATGSPFSSPRASPRSAYAIPHVAQGSSVSANECGEQVGASVLYNDYCGNTVDWLVDEDGTSNTSSSYTHELGASGGDWPTSHLAEMTPYDILRSVLRDEKSNEEIERALELNGYDLSAAIMSLMDGPNVEGSNMAIGLPEQGKTFLIGKSVTPASRPVTPVGQTRGNAICRYWLSIGQCLRADCRFSHDLSSHVCKYWLAGKCLAGDSCIFSHDPSSLMESLALNQPTNVIMTPPLDYQQSISYDHNSFPSLLSTANERPATGSETSLRNLYATQESISPPPGIASRPALAPEFIPSQAHSRPNSRHHSPGPRPSKLVVDDKDAFPTLGSAAFRGPKKHHGKRGHSHGHKERDNGPSSLADVVRTAPAHSPLSSPRRALVARPSYTDSRENSAAALAIPPPEHIPWLETGERANTAYLKARQEAIKHGGARNKFLQSAAQAWNRNDVRAAKALSLRGQSENDLMREAHREAARALYDERNKHSSASSEDFVDLHGLHPVEAVSYLATALTAQRSRAAVHRGASAVLYAIVGTGHHSKNGKDKVGKAIRAFLCECRYAFREFSVPGDRGGSGGILGVDASSGDASGGTVRAEGQELADGAMAMQHGKIKILKAEDAKGGGF